MTEEYQIPDYLYEDSLTEKIGDREVKFPRPGAKLMMSVATRIREIKHEAFNKGAASLQNVSDLGVAMSVAGNTMRTYLSGMSISNEEMRQWCMTPEGNFFLVQKALDPILGDNKERDRLMNLLTPEQMFRIGDFLACGLFLPKLERPKETSE